ncbi:MAG: hypothetical protein COC17_01685 [Hyphomicrobiales bacterium]|nr:MAG: hypothetical protein COC17_02170 [Hyphomicrobiales bacterium]PCH51349.1 MAG: hypothetical protein COC17_01685 [Hyphomicrobiales bacterium]
MILAIDSNDGNTLDDLNKPLGQKPVKEVSKEPKKQVLSLSAIATILGISAIGFIAYDRFFSNPNGPNLQTENNTNQHTTPNVDLRATLDGNSLELKTDKPLNEHLGKTQKIETVEPTGTMIASKPKTISEQSPSGTFRKNLRDLPKFKPQKPINAHLPDTTISQNSVYGILPKLGKNGQKAMDIYARAPETSGNFGVARVVIIVASMGISQSSTQQAISQLSPNFTFAFAPYGNSLNRWMQASRKKGHELLLQVPMEPFGYPQNNPGKQTLRTGVSAAKNIDNLHWSMGRITNYVGVMNYLGGKISNDAASLKPIFTEISDRGLLFVDDGSSTTSVTQEVAEQSLLPFVKGHIRIDKIRTKREIAKNLEKLVSEAKRTGLAIGIANAFPETIKLLAQFAEKAPGAGIELTPVSAIVSDPTKK